MRRLKLCPKSSQDTTKNWGQQTTNNRQLATSSSVEAAATATSIPKNNKLFHVHKHTHKYTHKDAHSLRIKLICKNIENPLRLLQSQQAATSNRRRSLKSLPDNEGHVAANQKLLNWVIVRHVRHMPCEPVQNSTQNIKIYKFTYNKFTLLLLLGLHEIKSWVTPKVCSAIFNWGIFFCVPLKSMLWFIFIVSCVVKIIFMYFKWLNIVDYF